MAGGSRYESNDYRCENCGHEFDALELRSERDFSECPKCKKKAERVIGVKAGWMEDFEGVKTRVNRDVKEMDKKVKNRNENFIANIAGEKTNPLKK